ncbi:MAG: ABC transporter ATP-binding protein [Pirellulaceae bacterium]|nr:ABC transporter ATP-binding protein [Pirellulaceae bacterium]
MQSLISLDNVFKRFGAVEVLRGVNLEINPGVTGLLGPNGAGKSTLIKMLLGLVSADRGNGQVLGYRLGTQGRQLREKVGYVPEEDCYITGLSGVEAVQFAACLAGLPQLEALRRAHEILDFCGMKQERYRMVETFSTGMRQKIKFASAIVHDPQYLILDEPTSGLDPEEREQLLNRVRTLATGHGKSVLLSTHILPDVQQVCDQVVILAKGEMRLNEAFHVLDRPTSPTLTVSLLSAPDAFVDAARRSGLEVVESAPGQLRVAGQETDLSESIWAIAEKTQSIVQSIRPAKNSLEEIFLSAVQEAHHADL